MSTIKIDLQLIDKIILIILISLALISVWLAINLSSLFFEKVGAIITGFFLVTYGNLLVGKKIKWIIIAAGAYIILAIPLDMILIEYNMLLYTFVNLEVLLSYIIGLCIGKIVHIRFREHFTKTSTKREQNVCEPTSIGLNNQRSKKSLVRAIWVSEVPRANRLLPVK